MTSEEDKPAGQRYCSEKYGSLTIPEMLTIIMNRDKYIIELEDLFLMMYELGSSYPSIEDKVETTVARIVERQDGKK